MLNSSKMSNETKNCEVERFMQQPLVTWFRSCLKPINKENCTYEELVDGVLIHHVFLQMDLHVVDSEVTPSQEDARRRARNLRAVLANMRHFYEEERGHLLLRVPQVARLAREPRLHVADAELLLCLLLGCAVQCPKIEAFIARITDLDKSCQGSIAECIKQVVNVPNIVLSPEMLSRRQDEPEAEAELDGAFEHVRRLYRERNECRNRLRSLMPKDSSFSLAEDDEEEEVQEAAGDRSASCLSDVELAHCRAQMRRQREELKETHEELHECREELRQCREHAAQIQKENEILVMEARNAKSYRDELDAATERAEKASRLEQEITRYRERLADSEYLKSRLTELQEINQLLVESKEKLDDELAEYRAKVARAHDLEKQFAELQRRNEELVLQVEESRRRQRELFEENTELNTLLKISTKEALESGFSMEPVESPAPLNSSLSEQLNNSAQSQALKLELENRRLSSLVDSLKETSSARGNHSEFLKLERENRRLSTTMDSLRGELDRCREALQQRQARRSPAQPPCSSDLERRCDELTREKQRLQSLLERVQRRCLELERDLNEARQRLELDSTAELRLRVNQLEAEACQAISREHKLECLLADAQASQTVVRRVTTSDGSELLQLQQDFGRLYREYQRLHARLAELGAELEAKGQRVLEADRQAEQLQQRCADLMREKAGLLEHASQLVQNYTQLFAQTLEDKEHYHAEERKNRERVNDLCRQKEKLEDKIMDHYRRMEPSSAGKKRSIGTNLVKSTLFKMRRASSGLFNRSRRSWAEESSERSYDFDFTRGHESDGGANVPRNRKSVDFLENFRPSEFSFQMTLESRSRKSVDFMDMMCAEDSAKIAADGDELDKTLHNESKEGDNISLFGKNKSVDLSLEDLLEEPEHEVPEKHSAILDELDKTNAKLQQSRSRKSVWIEQGCV